MQFPHKPQYKIIDDFSQHFLQIMLQLGPINRDFTKRISHVMRGKCTICS